MKAITLWQPFASLIAVEAKRFETRSWSTHYRGPLAIHAAKRKPEGFSTAAKVLGQHGYSKWSQLPVGCVVAVVCLVDVISTYGHWTDTLDWRERDFGDFSPGRYAWRLELIERIEPPIPAQGSQGFWEWDAGSREHADLPLFRLENNRDQPDRIYRLGILRRKDGR